MSQRDAVGFIGLGNIGAPMAKTLRNWPGGLVVHDALASAMDPFIAKGATPAASGAQVAQLASVICVMVQNAAQVEAVMVGPDGILATAAPGTVIAVHSTISPDDAERLAGIASDAGVELIDAPVSGGAIGAHGGTLAVMAGGSADAVARCERVFDHFAALVVHMGPVGAGTKTKIARNLVTFASFAAVGEAQRLAEAAGLDLAKLGDVVRHSDAITGGAGAIMLRDQAGEMSPDDGLRPIFAHSAVLGNKDLALAIKLAASLDVEVPLAELAMEYLESALGVAPLPRRDGSGT